MNEKGEPEIGDVGADAQIVPSRGVIVTNAKSEPMPEEITKILAEFFGPDARHENDYTLYYSNIKDNVAKRIAAYHRAGKDRYEYFVKSSYGKRAVKKLAAFSLFIFNQMDEYLGEIPSIIDSRTKPNLRERHFNPCRTRSKNLR